MEAQHDAPFPRVQPPEQVDYRENPSFGEARDPDNKPILGYDQPVDPGSHQIAPMTDQTWKGYDSPDDAYRYNGINTPEEQAQLHADPSVDNHQGYSPGIAEQLAWERAVSGAPPK